MGLVYAEIELINGDDNGGFENVVVETDFKTFYELLSETDPSDSLLAAIKKRIAAPSKKNELIDLVDGNEVLCFTNHIFFPGIICEEDDLGNLTHPEENAYMLPAYINGRDCFPTSLPLICQQGKRR